MATTPLPRRRPRPVRSEQSPTQRSDEPALAPPAYSPPRRGSNSKFHPGRIRTDYPLDSPNTVALKPSSSSNGDGGLGSSKAPSSGSPFATIAAAAAQNDLTSLSLAINNPEAKSPPGKTKSPTSPLSGLSSPCFGFGLAVDQAVKRERTRTPSPATDRHYSSSSLSSSSSSSHGGGDVGGMSANSVTPALYQRYDGDTYYNAGGTSADESENHYDHGRDEPFFNRSPVVPPPSRITPLSDPSENPYLESLRRAARHMSPQGVANRVHYKEEAVVPGMRGSPSAGSSPSREGPTLHRSRVHGDYTRVVRRSESTG